MKIASKKVWISFASALVFGAAAISALGPKLNLNIGFMPSFLGSDLTLKVFLLLAGILLLYDSFSFHSQSGNLKISSVLAGFLLAFLGAFPLLDQLGMLDFLPFVVELNLSSAVLAGLLLFYSLYLLWDVYLLFRE